VEIIATRNTRGIMITYKKNEKGKFVLSGYCEFCNKNLFSRTWKYDNLYLTKNKRHRVLNVTMDSGGKEFDLNSTMSNKKFYNILQKNFLFCGKSCEEEFEATSFKNETSKN